MALLPTLEAISIIGSLVDLGWKWSRRLARKDVQKLNPALLRAHRSR